jgi:uroporphyrin-III C-methyltransferase
MMRREQWQRLIGGKIGTVARNKGENEVQRSAKLASNHPTHSVNSQRNLSKPETGILIVGHGSRRQEANDDLREVARRLGERGRFSLIEAAFLEIEQPNVAEGFVRLVGQGAGQIIVHPYFLSPGRHTRGDLPREVSEVAARHPHIRYRITEPLSAHPLVVEASLERIRAKSLDIATEPAKVHLVGAGPGNPELLTVRARNLLATCDVILYDYLVDHDILRLAPPSVEQIPVGKVGRGRCTPQTRINQMLIESARAGKRVVRLKGGDPFLFGRGGEEAEALYLAGIPFEIVPGVSSALAVPGYAGIPLTHRSYSSSVAVISGAHANDGACNVQALQQIANADTIVILMGIANLREIATSLLAAGRDEETPVAVISWGTYEDQQTVTGTLNAIADQVAQTRLGAPAVIVVGEVVRLRERLDWFREELPGAREFEAAFAAA